MHAVKAKLQKKKKKEEREGGALLFILSMRGGVNVMFRRELYITSCMALACQQDRAALVDLQNSSSKLAMPRKKGLQWIMTVKLGNGRPGLCK